MKIALCSFIASNMFVEIQLEEYLNSHLLGEMANSHREGTKLISMLIKSFAAMHNLDIKEELPYETEYLNGSLRYGRIDFELVDDGTRYPIEIDSTNKIWSLKKIITKSYEQNSLPIWIRWCSELSAENDPIGYHLIDITHYKVLPKPEKGLTNESKVRFGKYKGQSVEEIFKINPSYIDWCLLKMEIFCLNDDSINFLESLQKFKFSPDALRANKEKQLLGISKKTM